MENYVAYEAFGEQRLAARLTALDDPAALKEACGVSLQNGRSLCINQVLAEVRPDGSCVTNPLAADEFTLHGKPYTICFTNRGEYGMVMQPSVAGAIAVASRWAAEKGRSLLVCRPVGQVWSDPQTGMTRVERDGFVVADEAPQISQMLQKRPFSAPRPWRGKKKRPLAAGRKAG